MKSITQVYLQQIRFLKNIQIITKTSKQLHYQWKKVYTNNHNL